MHSAQTKTCSMASSCGMVIPKRVKYLSESELPYNYSKTPGGTIYSTTPGGTRITYEREQLINLRNSPMSRTPPKNLPYIAGVTKETEYNKKYPTITEDINKNKLSSTQIKIEEHPETEFELEL